MNPDIIKQLGTIVMANKKKYDDQPLYLKDSPIQSQPQPLGDAFVSKSSSRLPWAWEVLERSRTQRSATVSPLLSEWLEKQKREE